MVSSFVRGKLVLIQSEIWSLASDARSLGIFFGTPEKTVPDPYFDGKGPDRTGCTFCGACMIGCPVGAKNTLDKNYLFLARGKGAKVIAETLVTGVRPISDGYEVITTSIKGIFKKETVYRVKGVIFSGGVLGTVKLLSQCKDKGLLPHISEELGNFVRTNSEALIGVKSFDKTCDWNDQIAITSGIYPDKTTHIEIVRYNKGSDVLLNLYTIMAGGGGSIPRVIRYLGNIAKHPLQALKLLLWPLGKAASMSVLLVMQTDKNHLKLGYKKRWWRLGDKSKLDHYGIVRTYHVKNTHQRGCAVERTALKGSRLHFSGSKNWLSPFNVPRVEHED